MAPTSDHDELGLDIPLLARRDAGADAPDPHRTIEQLAASHASVLLIGEPGVGAAHWALAIHRRSSRASRAFVILSCAAAPELLESELLGYEGPSSTRAGLLETAEGGTLFLDEIHGMPQSVQATLLRVLETGRTLRVGATQARACDVRILAATQRDLEAEVAAGRFRRDLHDRLAAFKWVIPSQRPGRGDAHRLERAPEPQPQALALIEERPSPARVPAASTKAELERLVAEAEVRELVEALASCGGNQTRAARILGISRRALVNRMARHRLPRPRGPRR